MLVLFSLAPAARFPQGIYPLHEAVDALNVAVVNLLITVPKYAVYVAAENKVLVKSPASELVVAFGGGWWLFLQNGETALHILAQKPPAGFADEKVRFCSCPEFSSFR